MSSVKFIIYSSGVFFSYLLFGIFQERVTRKEFGINKEKFTYITTLVLLQCMFNAILARVMLSTLIKQGVDKTSWKCFALSSLTYLAAMVATNSSLKHVSFPTQVVAKSCKPIPVMIMGVLFAKKRYSLAKYIFVSLIVTGVAIFMFKKQSSSQQIAYHDNYLSIVMSYITSLGSGELMLLFALAMDGLTSAVQDTMKTKYKTKSVHMMYKMNLWSSFYLVGGSVFSGEVYQFLQFVERNPAIVYEIAMFSSLSAIGQLFIFFTIAEFGPLTCSIITTTRKFFTMLFSVFLLGNHLTDQQWLGTCLVFTGLTLDTFVGKTRTKPIDKTI